MRVAEPLVLGYHALSEEWEATFSVTPERFARQLRLLGRRGFRGVTFSELAAAGPAPGERLVAITFDDAFRSVLTRAAPVLGELGFVGTVFVPTAFPGAEALDWPGIEDPRGGPAASELEPMDWPELERLAAAGWEIGAHTRTHPDLREVDDRRLVEELEGSKRDVEDRLGGRCRTMAYPFGYHDERVVAATRAAGYLAAVTQRQGRSPDHPLRWPRMGVYHHDHLARFAFKTTATGPRLARAVARLR